MTGAGVELVGPCPKAHAQATGAARGDSVTAWGGPASVCPTVELRPIGGSLWASVLGV